MANNTAVYAETDYHTRVTYPQYLQSSWYHKYLGTSSTGTSSTNPRRPCTPTAQRHNVIGTTYQHNIKGSAKVGETRLGCTINILCKT
eukprot:SAG31_NODE_62_length_28678_cov_21.548270_9_plen_88_part_00